jgi:hypothetical protein
MGILLDQTAFSYIIHQSIAVDHDHRIQPKEYPMHPLFRKSLAAIVVGMLTTGALALAADQAFAAGKLGAKEAVNCPTVRLQHWQEANKQERMAFLLGFATMLEMEKEWQGEKPLSIKKSINHSWVRGLDGVTFGDKARSLDEYIVQNPDKLDMSVAEALGRIYVAPKMTEPEKKEAGEHYQAIQKMKKGM